jgi:hypothetical protein
LEDNDNNNNEDEQWVKINERKRLSYTEKKKKLRGFSPQANYTDRATAASRRS